MENLVKKTNKLKLTYAKKKVLVTGHTGFKGSWLLKILEYLNAEVLGYALNPENSNDLYNLISGNLLCKSVIGDIRDKNNLTKTIIDFQPDFVFHLAAQPLVRESYKYPIDTFEINAIGTANLLESIRYLNKKCSIVLVTTDKVYLNNEWNYNYREIDVLGGHDPYSASKACAEIIIQSYRNSFFSEFSQINQKGLAVGRAGNVIGGGDWSKDRIVPDIIKSLIANEKIVIRNPESIRPWQHVLEPLVGYLLLGSNLSENQNKFSGAYNFGPNSEGALTVKKLVGSAVRFWGSGDYISSPINNELHEAKVLKLDIGKASLELGFSPIWNADQAIEQTIEWYKVYNQKKTDISIFTQDQIVSYFSLLNY
jgi:CDP-glucose 4,6-dehydratase